MVSPGLRSLVATTPRPYLVVPILQCRTRLPPSWSTYFSNCSTAECCADPSCTCPRPNKDEVLQASADVGIQTTTTTTTTFHSDKTPNPKGFNMVILLLLIRVFGSRTCRWLEDTLWAFHLQLMQPFMVVRKLQNSLHGTRDDVVGSKSRTNSPSSFDDTVALGGGVMYLQ